MRLKFKILPGAVVVICLLYYVWNSMPSIEDSLKTGMQRTMVKDFYSGGNVLDFFRIPMRNAMEVSWVHRVNEQSELEAALKDDSIMMLEADVRLRNETPVMAHDPTDLITTDQTLEEWLVKVCNSSRKGIKLDFKSTDVLEPSFKILKSMAQEIRVPVWINSDILRGPNSVTFPVNATHFFAKVEEIFPHSTLSIGWTTNYKLTGNNEWYSQEMVVEMYSYCVNSRQAITFPVRASLVGNDQSIPAFKWLLSKSNRYSLTVWHSGVEQVNVEDLVKIHESFKLNQVYYDLPEELMNEFRQALLTGN